MHRVTTPDEDRWSESARLSIVFFHETNWDAEIVALDVCTSADDPPRYPPTTAGQHNYERVMRQQTLATNEV
jgi:isopenicillin N synthase-like dioxygenase